MVVLGILFFYISVCVCVHMMGVCMHARSRVWAHTCMQVHVCVCVCVCVCEGMCGPEVDVNSLAQSLSTGAS